MKLTEEARSYLDKKYMNAMPDAIYRREVEKAIVDPILLSAQGLSSVEWISAKDELPNISGEVLRCVDGKIFCDYFFRDMRPCCFNYSRSDKGFWMPLPAPPTTK